MQQKFIGFFISFFLCIISANVFAKSISHAAINIGDSYGGGTVFFIDNSVSPARGLIAGTQTSVTGDYIWGDFNGTVSTSPELFMGDLNTNGMLSQAGGSPAALAVTSENPAPICESPIITCTDWYLPSLKELILLWTNKDIAGIYNIKPATYWSSTESTARSSSAWIMTMRDGNVGFYGKTGTKVNVYPIRAFVF